MRNVEIKVRISNHEELLRRAVDGGARFHDQYDDADTYFHVAHGRLKLRMTAGKKAGSLIYYERADEASSRISDYRLVDVADGDAMLESLSLALGVLVTVKKSRRLLMDGDTRIHLDDVEGLGNFVELETVVRWQPLEIARQESQRVFDYLQLEKGEVVAVSYSDLLLHAMTTQTGDTNRS